MPPPMTVKIDGPQDGEPVVFLHGFPLDHTMWDFQVEPLAKSRYRTLRFDLPGHGRSTIPEKAPTMSEIATMVVQAAALHRASQFHLVGFSLGGYVALQLALDHPDKVKTLTLIDTRAEPDSEEAKKGRLETIQKLKTTGMQVLVDAMMPKLLTERTLTQQTGLVQSVKQTILRNKPEGAARALETMMGRPDQRPRLSEIKCKTLIVVGAEDKLTPVDASRVLQQGIPGSQLRVVTGAAHLVPMEAPGPLNHFLEDFLRGQLKPMLPRGIGPGAH